MENRQYIGVIGCGNMGSALARRLLLSGYNVLMGSRRPEHHRHDTLPVEIISIAECIRLSPVLFIAIHAEYYESILVSLMDKDPSLFDGKILIDLSNQTEKDRKHTDDVTSNAERLQAAIPNAYVVKAFNTISSFILESTTAGEPRCVLVASDHSSAKDQVISLVRDMTFEPYNTGSLRAARQLEISGRSLFPRWHMPLIFAATVFFLWLVFILYKKFISEHKTSWDQFFASLTNKSLCASAITLLASAYMPSNLACLFQLAYGTKLRPFPSWLNNWLLSRKQLGLLTFTIGACHGLIPSILMSPEYFENWYKPGEFRLLQIKNKTQIIVPLNLMVWSGELAALLGVLTLLIMSLLAIASIPAVGNLLNWREWQFVQSKLGTCTLLLAVGHVFAMALPVWIRKGFVKTVYSIGFPTVIFPLITLLMKFIMCLPCFSRPISRIRRGEDFTQRD